MNHTDNRRNFVITSSSQRVWLSADAPYEVREYLGKCSKWCGSDKREGARISFEISRFLDLVTVASKLVEMGMINCSHDLEAVDRLTR